MDSVWCGFMQSFSESIQVQVFNSVHIYIYIYTYDNTRKKQDVENNQVFIYKTRLCGLLLLGCLVKFGLNVPCCFQVPFVPLTCHIPAHPG